MEVSNRQHYSGAKKSGAAARLVRGAFYYLAMALCCTSIFHSSLLVTSQPLRAEEIAEVEDAVNLLEARGFRREAFILRNFVVFRNTDNWLNAVTQKENAYAAANFPLNIITLYPDFFTKAQDAAERAMILLHEARHLQGADERDAYEYAWRNRHRVGWTIPSHGTTDTYIAIEELTREIVPELFICTDKPWGDCTETLPLKPANLAKTK